MTTKSHEGMGILRQAAGFSRNYGGTGELSCGPIGPPLFCPFALDPSPSRPRSSPTTHRLSRTTQSFSGLALPVFS
jgi:hypothetical protein